jgi:hypothetical protein
MDVQTEHYLLEKKVPVPATFPMLEIRKSDLSKTSAGNLAFRLMALLPEAREIMDNQTKPIPFPPIKLADLNLADNRS